MGLVAQTNGELEKLSAREVAELTRMPKAKTSEEKREAVRRATHGLRVGVRVTPALYGRR